MDNTNRIFLHKVFKAIADSIIKIFIPLYILKSTGSINLAIGYLVVYSFFVFVLQIALQKLYTKYPIICMALHCIPIIIAQTILSFCHITLGVMTITALLMSISQVIYSVPLNIIFALNDKKTNVAKFQIATNAGKIIFIIISGLLLSKVPNSFLFLSIAATIIYIASIIPILKLNKSIKNKQISQKPTPYGCNFTFRLYHITFGLFQAVIDNLIPLYLYANNLSFESITVIIALVEVFKILANMLAKFLISRRHFMLSCILSFVIFAGSLTGLFIFKIPIVLYILSSIIAISFPLTFVPLFFLFCRQSKSYNATITDMTLRDIEIFSARPLYYGLFYLTGFLGPITLGLSSALTMFICQINLINKRK